VVGRTGAGKRTVSLALTRIVEIEEGSIEIDGQNISNMNIKKLRDKITIIP
jgi:ATP-binding cassette subfamily C (CFTR/MRP) protein 1